MEPTRHETSKDIKYLRTERGIAYFEEGWWMHDVDRLQGYPGRPMRRNEETKQIEPDYTIYP